MLGYGYRIDGLCHVMIGYRTDILCHYIVKGLRDSVMILLQD